jgi:hypothetical protein
LAGLPSLVWQNLELKVMTEYHFTPFSKDQDQIQFPISKISVPYEEGQDRIAISIRILSTGLMLKLLGFKFLSLSQSRARALLTISS